MLSKVTVTNETQRDGEVGHVAVPQQVTKGCDVEKGLCDTSDVSLARLL